MQRYEESHQELARLYTSNLGLAAQNYDADGGEPDFNARLMRLVCVDPQKVCDALERGCEAVAELQPKHVPRSLVDEAIAVADARRTLLRCRPQVRAVLELRYTPRQWFHVPHLFDALGDLTPLSVHTRAAWELVRQETGFACEAPDCDCAKVMGHLLEPTYDWLNHRAKGSAMVRIHDEAEAALEWALGYYDGWRVAREREHAQARREAEDAELAAIVAAERRAVQGAA